MNSNRKLYLFYVLIALFGIEMSLYLYISYIQNLTEKLMALRALLVFSLSQEYPIPKS